MRMLRMFFLFVVLIACTAQSTEAQTVYITKTGAKYHRGSCQYLRKSKFAITMKEAVDRGYEACSVCEPGGLSKDPRDPKVNQKSSDAASKQCTATTQAGTRCKRMTTNANGKCYQHQ